MVGRVGVTDLQGVLVGAAYAIVAKAASRRLFVETILTDVYENNSRKSRTEVIVECREQDEVSIKASRRSD